MMANVLNVHVPMRPATARTSHVTANGVQFLVIEHCYALSLLPDARRSHYRGHMKSTRTVGVWALILAILAPVWLFGGLYAVLFSMSGTPPVIVSVLANVAAFGWFIVPIALLGSIVLAIIAIVSRRGRGFGTAALVVLLVAAILVVLFVAASFGMAPI